MKCPMYKTIEIKKVIISEGPMYMVQSVRVGSKGQFIYWSEFFERTAKGLAEAKAYIRHALNSTRKVRV